MILNKILLVHYIADFLLQTRWMGENKSKKIEALSVHIIVYTLFMVIFFGYKFAIINGIAHFIVDYITSKLTTYFYINKNMYMFWAIIGLDQMIHIITLNYTYNNLF